MTGIRIELQGPDDDWREIGQLPQGEVGSFSSTPDSGRMVYVFGTLNDGSFGLFESELGADIEKGAERRVLSVHMTKLSDLTEPYPLSIWRDSNLIQLRLSRA